MAIILYIDTSTEHASVCLAEDNAVLGTATNQEPKEHSSWLHPAISQLLGDAGILPVNIHAVGVTLGPGSYTGLRVGLSAAKGLCFSLDKPLIGIGTLELMALAADSSGVDYICPMIDARRMEVFTALYTADKKEIQSPHALILEPSSFGGSLSNSKILFAGNGAAKFRGVTLNRHAIFKVDMPSATDMIVPVLAAYHERRFTNVAYTEPIYAKEFYQGRN